MSLNTIELPDPLIAALYGDHLLIMTQHAGSSQPATLIPTPPVARIRSSPPASPATQQIPAAASSQHAPAAASPQQPSSLAPTPQTSSLAPVSAPVYKFLGNNQKKITILVDSPECPFLPDDQLAFLSKMLEACKMNMGDVAIVNQANSGADIAELKRQLFPASLLLLGPGPEDIRLPIHFPLFKIQAFDQCSFLWTPPLAQFLQPGEEGKLLKTKLWVCLRTLFSI